MNSTTFQKCAPLFAILICTALASCTQVTEEKIIKEDVEGSVYSAGIEIAQLPATVNYFTNGKLDLTGLVVKMNKTDGSSVELTENEYTTEPADGATLSEEGSQPVKITADGKTAYFSVYVGKTAFTSLQITSLPDKTYYADNETFDTTGLEVTAVFNNGTDNQKRVLEPWEYTISIHNGSALTPGSGQKVTVNYSSKSTQFVINVSSTWETYTPTDTGDHILHDINRGNTKLRTVTIPSTITKIESYAFYGCTALESITIPKSVTEIEKRAFYGCSSLKTIEFEEDDSTLRVQDEAFAYCETVTELDFKRQINTWYNSSNNTFASCTALKKVTFENYAQGISFADCTALESVNFNSKCAWENNCYIIKFENCTALTEVKNMNYCQVFTGCTALKEIAFTAGTSIPDNAFKDCVSLTSVTIPDTVQDIANYAFMNCKNLTSVTLPNSVMKIYTQAFYGCQSLTLAQLPQKLSELVLNAFFSCNNIKILKLPITLETLHAGGVGRPTGGLEVFADEEIELHYEGTQELFKKLKIWNYWDLIGSTIYCSDGSFVYEEE